MRAKFSADSTKIFYEGHYWDNWINVNIDCILILQC